MRSRQAEIRASRAPLNKTSHFICDCGASTIWGLGGFPEMVVRVGLGSFQLNTRLRLALQISRPNSASRTHHSVATSKMPPQTRSLSRAAISFASQSNSTTNTNAKRKPTGKRAPRATKKVRVSEGEVAEPGVKVTALGTQELRAVTAASVSQSEAFASSSILVEPLPITGPFSFLEAKRHLIQVDSRFTSLFERLACRPFQQPEEVDPFR